MSTFLDITNEVLRRLNEVQIDSGDFTSVRSVQALSKDAVNAAIREVLQVGNEWHFTIETTTQTCTVGEGVYSFSADYSKADWETFYIRSLNNENVPQRLLLISYDEYVRLHKSSDDQLGTGEYGVPAYVYMTPDQRFGVTPLPKDEYVIEYRYWKYPDDLVLATDVVIIPNRFKHVVIDGAMMYMMQFRSNDASYNFYKVKFEEGIKTMRRLLQNPPVRIYSTVINGSTSHSVAFNV